MKNNNNKNRKIAVITFIILAILVGGIGYEASFGIVGTIVTILIIGLIIFLYVFFEEKLKEKVENISWEEPEVRKLQLIYDDIRKKHISEISNVRNRMFLKIVVLILVTIGSILLSNYYKKLELIFIISTLYVILQILIFIENYVKEEKCCSQIIKEFVEGTNRDDYNLNYIDKSNRDEYYKNKIIFEEEYKKFEDVANSIQTKDYINGCILKDISIKIANVRSKYWHEICGFKYHSRALPVYEGSYIIVEKNPNINLKIIFDKYDYKFDENELLKIDDEKFNKYYKAYSNDKENAVNFLTSELLNFITDFREKYQIKFEIVFKDKIYIKFYTEDMFGRERITAKNDDKVLVSQYYVMIKFVSELIEILNRGE